MAKTNKVLRSELETAVESATDAAAAAETRGREVADAAEVARDVAERARLDEVVAHSAAESANNYAEQCRAEYNDANNQLKVAKAEHENAGENARLAAEGAAESERAAKSAVKAKDELFASNETLQNLLTNKTASVLAEGYTRDSQPDERGDRGHWYGMAAIVLVIVGLQVTNIVWGDGSFFGHTAAIAAMLPLWVCVAMINRSWNDRRMVRQECAHAARVMTAIVGFKHEFGEETKLGESVQPDSPIGKVLAAIERNPAGRMKVGTDGLWGVLLARADRKDTKGQG